MPDCPKCKHFIYCDPYKILFQNKCTEEPCEEFIEKADKQIDIFGNETRVAEIARREKQRRKRYRTMQEIYGVKEGLTCKTCKHAVRHRQAGTWYKCELWAQTHSAATDIRLKDPACNKYEWEGANE